MDYLHSHIATTLGLVLATALLAGLLADLLRLPKVTAYLLVGILLGQSGLGILGGEIAPRESAPSAAAVESPPDMSGRDRTLHTIAELAMALVLFSLGCHFPLTHIRRIYRTASRLAVGDVGVTFVLVGLGIYALGGGWETALLLGALAIATAPATTVLVLKESESEGPVTELAEALVVTNNFAAMVVFELACLLIFLTLGPADMSIWWQFGQLAQGIFGSLLLGAFAGALVSLGCGLLSTGRWLVLLVSIATLLLGVTTTLEIPYMLSFLAMGITVANTSGIAANIVASLDRLTGFLCVVFFVVHGAELDLGDFRAAGFIGGAYIALRSCGKFLGVYLTASWAGAPASVREWLGPTLIAQAGAAIALAELAETRFPIGGSEVRTIILGTVVFFELVGPLSIRHAVMNAGEVPLIRAVRHASATPLSVLKGMWIRLQLAIGRDPMAQRRPDQLTVRELLRGSIQTLHQSAPFEEVTSLIEHSRDNTYFVLNDDEQLVGVVRYSEISHVLFDREAAVLIRAEDLASPVRHVLYPEQSASSALALFRVIHDDCIPVVTEDEEARFVGELRRRDVVGYLIRREQEK